MPINVLWDDPEKTIIRLDYQGAWDWDEYDRAIDHAFDLTRAVAYRTYVILDTTDGASSRGNALMHIRRTISLYPANLEMAITVGVPQTSMLRETIMTLIFRFYPKAADFASSTNTLAEARSLITARKAKKWQNVKV